MPRQLVQEGGTCWFYSILNCMLLSKLGRRVLLKKVNSLYRSLSPEQKALFDNKYLCMKATPQNRGFVFLKFASNFWKGKVYRKKAEKLIGNLGINNAEHKAVFGSYANMEREKMLRTLKIPFSVLYSDKPEKFKGPGTRNEMVIKCHSSLKKSMGMYEVSEKVQAGLENIPLTLPGYPSFELDHATLSLSGKDKNGRTFGHAVSCVRLPNGEYRIIEPNGNQDPCEWTKPSAVRLFVKSGWYQEAYDWDITQWGYNSIVYIRNDSKLPKFLIGKETPVNLGVNKEGQKILVGPRGGRYVQLAVGKAARPEKKALMTAKLPEKNGTNSRGRVIYKGPEGGRFVIYQGPDGKRYKRYLRTGAAASVKTPAKKKPVGTNSKGRAIYKGPDGGRYVIVTSKDGTRRYKKYMPKQK